MAVNIVQNATGVIEGGRTCGVAYLNRCASMHTYSACTDLRNDNPCPLPCLLTFNQSTLHAITPPPPAISLTWASNTVWASCNCGLAAIPQIVSHEVGHIFSLRHDGHRPSNLNPYLFGLPAPGVVPTNRRWNAIMGGVGKSHGGGDVGGDDADV